MNILVFDTCLDKMYVALAQDENVLTSKIVENKDNKYHSAFLISTVKEILKENKLAAQSLDLIGTNVGPGSFTGIRACTTVARVMAQQLNLSAVGVSSLEIIANATEEKPVAVALDARKNSAYFYIDNDIQGAVELESVKEKLNESGCYLITDEKLQPILGGISYTQQEYDLGNVLAKLVYKKYKTSSENNFEWQKLKPLYIQPPPVFSK